MGARNKLCRDVSEDLDRFFTLRDSDPDLAKTLAQPMDLERFLGLAAELQQDQTAEARRPCNFIHG